MHYSLANLRHLYENLVRMDQKEIAEGLLSPAIRQIEKMAASRDEIARIIDPKAMKARQQADDILVLLGLVKKINFEEVAENLYTHYTDNHPTIHTNRFPTWDELNEKSKEPWLEEARKVADVQ